MATITTRPMTVAEFSAFVSRPENANRSFELDEGELVEVTRPKPAHGLICVAVSSLLWSYCRQRGRGYVLGNDTGVILSREPDTLRGPDVMLYDDGKTLAQLELEDQYPETPPILVAEVLSPTDRYGQLARKVAQYLNAGVRHVWVVDPPVREVTVYRPGAEPIVVGLEGALDGGEELPGLSLKVADLFRVSGDE